MFQHLKWTQIWIFGTCLFLSPMAFAKDMVLSIKVPENLRKKKTSLRIKNRATNINQIIKNPAAQVQMGAKELEALGFHNIDELSAGLEVFVQDMSQAKPRLRPLPLSLEKTASLRPSLLFDQRLWLRISYRISIQATKMSLVLDDAIPVLYSPSANKLVKDGASQLFEKAWAHYRVKRYDLGRELFDQILESRSLSPAQNSEAYLGRAIGSFHQRGCAVAEPDFDVASRNPKNRDDAKYYKALCLMEAKKALEAREIFKSLVDKNHEKYAEPSRLYLGFVAESLEEFDLAESAYLDTQDFAEDSSLVSLASERLKLLKTKQEVTKQKRLFGAALSMSAAYDTNVISLPQGLSAADQKISNKESASGMGNAFLEFRPELVPRLSSALAYSALVLHYAQGDVANVYDVQSHDLRLNLDYSVSSKNTASLSLSYGTVFLGQISKFREYMRSSSMTLKWASLIGSEQKPSAAIEYSLKATLLQPQVTAQVTTLDQRANSYVAGVKYSFLGFHPHVLGPGVEVEYRPAKGQENSYQAYGLYGHWSVPLFSQAMGLFLSNEIVMRYSNYFESASSRKDYLFEYTASFSKSLFEKYEAKLAVVQLLNVSSEKSSFQYDKRTATLSLGTMF